MSTTVQLGDRFEYEGKQWQVAEIAPRGKLRGAPEDETPAALLRQVCEVGSRGATRIDSAKRVVLLERLLFAYRLVGNFAVPSGFKVIHSGAWYVKTAAGNVVGAPDGERWAEIDACNAARRLGAEDAARFVKPTTA